MNKLWVDQDNLSSRSAEHDLTLRTIRVGLLWHSVSSGNLGVGALTLGNIALVRQVAAQMGLRPQFLVMSMRDGDSPPLLAREVETLIIDTRSLLSPGSYSLLRS